MIVKWLFLATALGLQGAILGSPSQPLSMLPRASQQDDLPAERPFPVNLGLEGAVTEEDWDKATIHDAPAPQIKISDFMGCGYEVTITGKTMKTIKDREIYAFQGLRYAQAPTGERRFKKTVPIGPYFVNATTISATHMGAKCPQMSMIGAGASGKEDCLFLNIYTPYLPEEGKFLPVMVWIHGGAFISGDASLYMPTRLLDKDIILVVIQYRIGSLGFFSLNNDDAPGNVGLWDQIEALKWVQANIEGFGGDPEKVTVSGESAGSASVNYLLLLKDETKGLFRGVLAESGSALDHWSLDPDPVTSAILIAERNGCANDSLKDLYDCMMKVPADQLSTVIATFVGEDRKAGQMGFRGAAPVVQDEGLKAALVTKHPKKYYEDGDVNDVPLFIGANKHEGAFVFGIMYWEFLIPNHRLEDAEYLREDMMKDLLLTFGIEDPSNGIGEALKDDYVGGRDLADFENATPGLVDLAGMLFLKAGAWETAKQHANKTTSKTFLYSFDFESDDTIFKIFFPDYKNAPFKHDGVCHADEMMYIYNLPASLDETQLKVKDKMVEMWTNFVIYGDPTPDEARDSWSKLNIPKWESLKTGNHHYMLIEEECRLMDEYPDRWHITLDEDTGDSSSTVPPSSTAENPVVLPRKNTISSLSKEQST